MSNELNDKLDTIIAARDNIKTSLENKGKTVTNDIRTYSNLVDSLVVLNGQTASVNPSTEQQVVEPDNQHNGLTQVTVNAVTAAIDNNIVASNIKKDVTILGVTGTLEAGDGLENKVTALENKIDELEAEVEGKAGGKEAKVNVYVQDNEPTGKDGIWIETGDYEIENIVGDIDIFENETWNTTKMASLQDIPFNFQAYEALTLGTDIYLFYGANKAYRYSTLTDTYTQITNSSNIIPYRYGAQIVGTDIFIFPRTGYKEAYKYDTLGDIYTRIGTMPYYGTSQLTSAVVGTDIYLFGLSTASSASSSKISYKYDTTTNTYTSIASTPFVTYDTAAINVGTDIYLFGSQSTQSLYNKVYKYDTTTNTYTQLTDAPLNVYQSTAVAVGTDIYLFIAANCYKYSTLTDTWTPLSNIPTSISNTGKATLIGDDDEIYLFSKTKVQILELNSADYENNSVVISQGVQKYLTTLVKNEAGLKYGFNNAWIYTDEDGLIRDLPTYYGNGTSWIKFKN